jgi:hypothetical protein
MNRLFERTRIPNESHAEQAEWELWKPHAALIKTDAVTRSSALSVPTEPTLTLDVAEAHSKAFVEGYVPGGPRDFVSMTERAVSSLVAKWHRALVYANTLSQPNSIATPLLRPVYAESGGKGTQSWSLMR